MEQTYTIYHKTGYSETDCSGICRISSLMGAMQDAATRHSELIGASRDVLMGAYGGFWMLVRLKLTLNRPIYAESRIEVRTWHRGSRGVLWYRDFEFMEDGHSIGRATTAWVVASWEERRILRPNHLPLITACEKSERNGEELPRLKMPANMAPAGVRAVRYSDLDINRHLGNTKYADIICDALELERAQGQYISDFRINYLHECPPGGALSLYAGRDGEDGTACCVSALLAEKTPSFEARVLLSRIQEER